MNIYIIRHGDDDDRYRGGWTDLPLIEKGIEKCEKLAKFMFENNIKGKGQTVSSIREIVKSTYSPKGLHHIIIIAYDDVMELLCTEFHNELITDNKQQTD